MKGRKLRICEYNVENLFISMEYYAGQDLEWVSEQAWREMALAQLQSGQKPLAKLQGLSKTVLDIDPDVLMLTEVGGRESLENLNRYFLNDAFMPYFVQGNSKRGIDLGFLVKKELPLRVEAVSNRETPIEVHSMAQGKHTARFSRDVAELRFYDRNELKLIVLLVHLKSRLSTEKDIYGKDVRTGEAIATAGLYEKLRAEYPEVPIILGGDFNAQLTSLELELLRRTDLADFHDLLDTPEEERVSFVHFDYAGRPYPQVLDYILISPHLRECVVGSESYTYRYKGFHGVPDELPRSRHARDRLPSDHYPVVLTVLLPP